MEKLIEEKRIVHLEEVRLALIQQEKSRGIILLVSIAFIFVLLIIIGCSMKLRNKMTKKSEEKIWTKEPKKLEETKNLEEPIDIEANILEDKTNVDIPEVEEVVVPKL